MGSLEELQGLLFSNSALDVYSLPSIILKVIGIVTIILIGILVGKTISYHLRKFMRKTEINRILKEKTVKSMVNILKWAIYLLFFAVALKIFPINFLGDGIYNFLVVIPAIILAFALQFIGLLLAVHIKDMIIDLDIDHNKLIGTYIFYSITFIFTIYSIKIALFPIGNEITTWAIYSYSVAFGAFVIIKTYWKNYSKVM